MLTTLADGRAVYYITAGTGEPILCIHGAGSDADTARPLIRCLRDQLHCIALDRLGYHRSAHIDGSTTLDEQVAAIAAVHSACTSEPAWVYGHSSGGNFALAYTVRYPDRVRGLALFEPPLCAVIATDNPVYGISAIAEEVVPAFRAGRIDEGIKIFFRIVIPGFPFDKLVGAGGWPVLRKNFESFLIDQPLALEWAPTAAEWQQMTLPVLILEGDGSGLFLREIATEISRLLPAAERITLPGCDHTAPIAQPDLVAEKILHFMERVRTLE